MADSSDPCVDGRPHPVPKGEISTHPTTVKEAEDLLTWLGGRSIFLQGLKQSHLNDEKCSCRRFNVAKQRFEVELSNADPPRTITVKFENISILTESEVERIKRQYPERELQRQFQNARVVEETKRLARSGPTSFRDPHEVKKTKGRGGINPGMCSCCDKPMTKCSEPETFMVEGHGNMIKVLAKDGGRGMDGKSINDVCSFLLRDMFLVGYGNIIGCECDAWRLMPISKEFPVDFDGCVHVGNNPLSPNLAEIYNANLAEGMLKVAWRKDDTTRFAAVELFILLIACSPPPLYIFTPEFPQYVSQLTQTLAAGKTDVCMAAQYAVMEIYMCACHSRPCDYHIPHFMEQISIPLQESVMSGQYRQMVDGRQGCFQGVPPNISFREVHANRTMALALCDECGKKESLETKLLGCSMCAQCFYCNKECQTKHWRTHHKKVCKQLVLLLKKNKALGWEPSTSKLMCLSCGFGPASKQDIKVHVASTCHDIHHVTLHSM